MTPQEAIEKFESIKRGNIYLIHQRIEGKEVFTDYSLCNIAIEALKKQCLMKINEIHVDEYYCPACGAENNCDSGHVEDRYCPNCGQKIGLE